MWRGYDEAIKQSRDAALELGDVSEYSDERGYRW